MCFSRGKCVPLLDQAIKIRMCKSDTHRTWQSMRKGAHIQLYKHADNQLLGCDHAQVIKRKCDQSKTPAKRTNQVIELV